MGGAQSDVTCNVSGEISALHHWEQLLPDHESHKLSIYLPSQIVCGERIDDDNDLNPVIEIQ